MIREPAVAGRFYDADPESLRKCVQSCLTRRETPIEAKGIVAPHAGYVYSGAVAGAVYGAVRLPQSCIILGPNHTGRGAVLSLHPPGEWRTPLGTAPVDEALNRRLLAECSLLQEEAGAHAREHSIEVQLPFLQVLAGAPRFAAICVGTGDYASLDNLGHALARTVMAFPEPVMLIVSSDMTHYESADAAARKDRLALDRIVELDPRGLYRIVGERDISMCGFAPAIAMIVACIDLGASRGELIRYANSGDVSGDHTHVVGYAGIAIA